ncbi:MAG: class II aldolase/adducin family protein [bacterium]|nr:class II aldolase/adducin family protein [bacterium]
MPNLVVLRRNMVEIGKLLESKSLIVAAEGNMSVRLSGHGFLVTPAGRCKGDLKVQDLLEVDLQGRCSRGRPTSEWPLHQEIYQLRPDIQAICHAHPPWATAFASAGRDLDGQLLTETAQLLPRVPLAARSLPGTSEVARSIQPHITAHDAILMANHGAVTVGRDLQSAYELLQTVERLAQVTLLSEMAAGSCGLNQEMLKKLVTGYFSD